MNNLTDEQRQALREAIARLMAEPMAPEPDPATFDRVYWEFVDRLDAEDDARGCGPVRELVGSGY